MYFTSLPDHSSSGFDEKLHFSKFNHHNIIFNAVPGKNYDVRHVGCLSMKTVFSGEEWYGINNRQLAVRPGQFLILNNDQEYTCKGDAAEQTRIFSVFFGKQFASSVLHDALHNEEKSLDDPFEAGMKPLEFFQTLTDTDSWLEQNLTSLITELNQSGYEANRVNEHLIFLLHHLIRSHKNEGSRLRNINAVKANTKTEIYKRLCVAKDLLHSSYMHMLDLSLISQAACLSTPQLVRQFKAAFQTTPHQYLAKIRLAHAAQLLKKTSAPVQEISLKCGFEDSSAFCRAFKSQHGMQPIRFRNQSSQDMLLS